MLATTDSVFATTRGGVSVGDDDCATCLGCDLREEVGAMGTVIAALVFVPVAIGLVAMLIGGIVHAIRGDRKVH
jgi:hypothetical protein